MEKKQLKIKRIPSNSEDSKPKHMLVTAEFQR